MKIYRHYQTGAWWHGQLCRIGMKDNEWFITDLWECLKYNKWHFNWNKDHLIFGAGRDWYDGPIWFIFCGIFSICLHPDGK